MTTTIPAAQAAWCKDFPLEVREPAGRWSIVAGVEVAQTPGSLVAAGRVLAVSNHNIPWGAGRWADFQQWPP